MTSLGRNLDKFDQAFYGIDMESMEQFFNNANNFDQRMTLLENWLCRKEEEYRSRLSLPTPEL